jgi:hypothetical protein
MLCIYILVFQDYMFLPLYVLLALEHKKLNQLNQKIYIDEISQYHS